MASRSLRLQHNLFAVILVNCNIITFVYLFGFCSHSSPDVNKLGLPFSSNAFKDLASMHEVLIVKWFWPHLKSVHGLCFRSLSVVHQQQIRSSPMWLPWFDFLAGNVGLSCSTFLEMSFDSSPLVRSMATTDETHEDLPVIEPNVILERIPAVV